MRTAELIAAVLSMEHVAPNTIKAAALGLPLQERPTSSLGELHAVPPSACVPSAPILPQNFLHTEQDENGVADTGTLNRFDVRLPQELNPVPFSAAMTELAAGHALPEMSSSIMFGLDSSAEVGAASAEDEGFAALLSKIWSDSATTTIYDLRGSGVMPSCIKLQRNVHHIDIGRTIGHPEQQASTFHGRALKTPRPPPPPPSPQRHYSGDMTLRHCNGDVVSRHCNEDTTLRHCNGDITTRPNLGMHQVLHEHPETLREKRLAEAALEAAKRQQVHADWTEDGAATPAFSSSNLFQRSLSKEEAGEYSPMQRRLRWPAQTEALKTQAKFLGATPPQRLLASEIHRMARVWG